MNSVKKQNFYMLVIAMLLVVASFCVQSSLAYFTDTDTIGSNQVNVPNITNTFKLNSTAMTLAEGEKNVYKATTVAGSNTITVSISTNIPVILRLQVIAEAGTVTYGSGFSASDDEYYYYNSLVSTSNQITVATINSASAEEITVAADVVQGNYYGLGAMIGYVQGVDYSSIDYATNSIIYSVSRQTQGNILNISGYQKSLEKLDISTIPTKTYQITAYGFTFKIIINVSA